MLPKNRSPWLAPMLLSLTLLLTACTSKPQPMLADCPAVPPLPAAAKQTDEGPLCSPTCSSALTKERESWQRLLTEAE